MPFPVVTSVFYVTREARYPSQRIYSVRMKFYVRSMLGFKAKDVTGDVCEVTLRRLLIIQRSAGIPDPDIKIKAQWTIHKELIHSELFGHMAIVHYQYPTENPQGFTAYNVATPLVGRVRDLWLMAHALEEEKDLAKAKEEASRKQWIFPGDIVPGEAVLLWWHGLTVHRRDRRGRRHCRGQEACECDGARPVQQPAARSQRASQAHVAVAHSRSCA